MLPWRVLSVFLLMLAFSTEGAKARRGKLLKKLSHFHVQHKDDGRKQRKDAVTDQSYHSSQRPQQDQSPLSDVLKNPAKIDESEKQELNRLQDFNNKQFVTNDVATETAELANQGIVDDSALRISNMAALPTGSTHGDNMANKAVIGLGNGLRASYGKDFDQDSLLYDESKWPEYRIKDSDYSQFPTFAEPVYNGNPNQGEFYDSQMNGAPYAQGMNVPGASSAPGANTFSNRPKLDSGKKPLKEGFGANVPGSEDNGNTGTQGSSAGPKNGDSKKVMSHDNKKPETPPVAAEEHVKIDANGKKIGKNPQSNSTSGKSYDDLNLSAEPGINTEKHVAETQDKFGVQLQGQNIDRKANSNKQTGNKTVTSSVEGNTTTPSDGSKATTSAASVNEVSASENDVKQGLNEVKHSRNDTKDGMNVVVHNGQQGAIGVKQGDSGNVNHGGMDINHSASNMTQGGNGTFIASTTQRAQDNIKEAIQEAEQAQVQSKAAQNIKEAQDDLLLPNQVQLKAKLQNKLPMKLKGSEQAQIRSQDSTPSSAHQTSKFGERKRKELNKKPQQ